jgi:hypothetical protein
MPTLTASQHELELSNIQNIERQDLLAGDPIYPEDQLRNTKFALFAGAIATLCLIVAATMSWVLYYRQTSDILLSHSIMITIAVVIAVLCLLWAKSASTIILEGKIPNALLIFILSLIFACYCLVSTLYIFLFRYFHYNWALSAFAQESEWNASFGSNWSFYEGWNENRIMLFWVCLFGLIAGLCFSFIAFAGYSSVWARVFYSRVALYLSLVSTVAFAFISLYFWDWANDATELPAYAEYKIGNRLSMLWWLLVAAVIFAFLNALIALLKWKPGHFLFVVVSLAFLVIFATANGQNLQLIRNMTTDGNLQTKCMENLAYIHRD